MGQDAIKMQSDKPVEVNIASSSQGHVLFPKKTSLVLQTTTAKGDPEIKLDIIALFFARFSKPTWQLPSLPKSPVPLLRHVIITCGAGLNDLTPHD
jgi:hypothetical protein